MVNRYDHTKAKKFGSEQEAQIKLLSENLFGKMTVNNGIIQIDRSCFGRPEASGEIKGEKGYIKYPDHKSLRILYDSELEALFFSSKEFGVFW